MNLIRQTVVSGQSQVMEYELEVPKGRCVFEGRTSLIPNYSWDQPSLSHVLWMARDITLKKHAQKTVEQLAFYDALTGLPNRRLMMNRLEQFLEKRFSFKSRLFITSGGKERTTDGTNHSPFTRAFVSVLRTDKNELVTFSEIVSAVEYLRPNPRYGEFEGHQAGGNFYFIGKNAQIEG